jgi:hypothetical protein
MSTPNNPDPRSPARSAVEVAAPTGALTASRAHYFDSKLKLFPGMILPLRSMLIDGAAQRILISPVATPEEQVHVAGAPLVLVAPSLLHHLHLAAAVERYRPVELWGPPGLIDKRPEFKAMRTLGVDAWPYAQLEHVLVRGAPIRNEVVFFHRASRTIYTADLFFHICRPEGFLSWIALRAMGVHRRFATARPWRHWVTDRAAFSRSIDEILAWDFDRIAVAHGEIVDRDARDRFEIALRELRLID